jgi:hypothetical protein
MLGDREQRGSPVVGEPSLGFTLKRACAAVPAREREPALKRLRTASSLSFSPPRNSGAFPDVSMDLESLIQIPSKKSFQRKGARRSEKVFSQKEMDSVVQKALEEFEGKTRDVYDNRIQEVLARMVLLAFGTLTLV